MKRGENTIFISPQNKYNPTSYVIQSTLSCILQCTNASCLEYYTQFWSCSRNTSSDCLLIRSRFWKTFGIGEDFCLVKWKCKKDLF